MATNPYFKCHFCRTALGKSLPRMPEATEVGAHTACFAKHALNQEINTLSEQLAATQLTLLRLKGRRDGLEKTIACGNDVAIVHKDAI